MQTQTKWLICNCGMLTNDDGHFLAGDHIVIDTIFCSSTLTAIDLNEMRDFASEFAYQWRIHDREMQAMDRVRGYNRRNPEAPLRMLDDGLGVFRGLVTVAKIYAIVGAAVFGAWLLWRGR